MVSNRRSTFGINCVRCTVRLVDEPPKLTWFDVNELQEKGASDDQVRKLTWDQIKTKDAIRAEHRLPAKPPIRRPYDANSSNKLSSHRNTLLI